MCTFAVVKIENRNQIYWWHETKNICKHNPSISCANAAGFYITACMAIIFRNRATSYFLDSDSYYSFVYIVDDNIYETDGCNNLWRQVGDMAFQN